MYRRKKVFHILAILLSFLMMISVVDPVQATTISDLEKEKQELEKQKEEAQNKQKEESDKLNSVSGRIDSIQGDADAVAEEIDEADAALVETLASVEIIEEELSDKEEEIKVTTAEYEKAKEKEEEQYEAMKKRIQFMYEKRDYVLLEMFFGSANFSDLLNRNDYIEQLSAYDRKQLTEYQETRASIEDKEARLESEKKDLDDLKTKVEAEQSSGQISDYQHQISETEQEMLAYEKQLEEQNNNIAQLQKQLEEERRLSQLAAQSTWRDISEITFADGDRYLLANLIYCEAGNQPYSGQVAVGAVVINRVKSAVFPDTVVGVIYQNKQFSPVASGRLALALAENHATQACYKAADEAMAGATTVGDCLFFRTPIEGLTGIQIGGHIFY